MSECLQARCSNLHPKENGPNSSLQQSSSCYEKLSSKLTMLNLHGSVQRYHYWSATRIHFASCAQLNKVLLDSGASSTLVNTGKGGLTRTLQSLSPLSLLWYVNARPHPCANVFPFVRDTYVSILKGNMHSKSTLNELQAKDTSTYKSRCWGEVSIGFQRL